MMNSAHLQYGYHGRYDDCFWFYLYQQFYHLDEHQSKSK